MEQTAIQIGNSMGMIIPQEILKRAGIKKGSKLFISLNAQNEITISTQKGNKSSVTPEFLNWLESFNREYGSALKELSDK